MIDLIYWLLLFVRIAALLYLLLMLIYIAGWQRLKSAARNSEVGKELVSIIIAMRNEAQNLENLLKALATQTFPANRFHIVLADDGSTDHSASLAQKLAQSLGIKNITILENESTGKKAALQTALKHAKGDWLLFTDADCVPHPDWVETMLAHARQSGAFMLLGPVKILPVSGLLSKFQACETNSLIAVTAGSAGIRLASMANGANMALRSSVLKHDDENPLKPQFASGDDMFRLEAVIHQYGSKSISMVMQPEAMVVTSPVAGLRAFFAQRMRWVSKSKGYRRPEIILPSTIVFAFNAFLAIILLLTPFFPLLLLPYVAFIVLKTFIDFPLVWPAFRLAGQSQLMPWFMVFQFVYPPYVLFTAMAGLLVQVNWKGRSI
jgi:cellulose synthase/poly-beta-1,6-N-acetylglucosamine synthase-like glycosyltransferase